MVPEKASVNLNSTTKVSAAKAFLRVRNSVNAPNAACATRVNASSLWVAASARSDGSGSVAMSAVMQPIRTSDAITT